MRPPASSIEIGKEHERAQALVVFEEPINQAHRKEIADLAAARHLPIQRQLEWLK
jgi:hypothetical protein